MALGKKNAGVLPKRTIPEKPSRSKEKNIVEGVSKDVLFHLQSKGKYELERKEETKKI